MMPVVCVPCSATSAVRLGGSTLPSTNAPTGVTCLRLGCGPHPVSITPTLIPAPRLELLTSTFIALCHQAPTPVLALAMGRQSMVLPEGGASANMIQKPE